MLIDAEESVLVMVDLQERLMPAIAGKEKLLRNCATLLQAARRLSVPLLASAQYPKGLGQTMESLAAGLAPEEVVEKITFSCLAAPEFAVRLSSFGRSQAVICGAEAHVCVLQTGLDLLARDYRVFVVGDATGSRDPANREAALARLSGAGATVVTVEMVLFEWLKRAGTEDFRAFLPLIK